MTRRETDDASMSGTERVMGVDMVALRAAVEALPNHAEREPGYFRIEEVRKTPPYLNADADRIRRDFTALILARQMETSKQPYESPMDHRVCRVTMYRLVKGKGKP